MTTAGVYWRLIDSNGLRAFIASTLADLEASQTIRSAILRVNWSSEMASAITAAYRDLRQRIGKADAEGAVRSSAMAEDLPDASSKPAFAG